MFKEIEDKGYIIKQEENSGEYQRFHLEGLELLQKLSSKNWTDYNEHDPGVTILENLAYTLTNLSYKADLPIIDILTEGKGKPLESGDNGFFIPSEILTTNPITSNDFRKVIIDQVDTVKNVWIKNISPSNNNDGQQQKPTQGLYQIEIELAHYDKDKSVLCRNKNETIEAIKKVFYSHRNLCENLKEIIILDYVEFELTLDLTLDKNVSGEEVFAHIWYKVSKYFSADIKLNSLWELLDKKESLDAIYDGPLLENGFINDLELDSNSLSTNRAELLEIISKVKGIISINSPDNFPIPNDPKTAKSKLENQRKILLLNSPKKAKLHYTIDGVKFSPDIDEVINQFNYLKSLNYNSFKAASTKLNTMELPKGKIPGISAYYPIRNQFPEIYGINEFGLPKQAPKERLAQAHQLNAYLLPFDQVMANCIAQIANIYSIYSPKENDLRSYFYQELEEMHKLIPLIAEKKSESIEETLEKWEQTLKKLNDSEDTQALMRLNQAADNLLARFAEEFPDYPLRKLNSNSYKEKIKTKHFNTKLLKWKEKLIKNYGTLSYNRAKGLDQTELYSSNSGKDAKSLKSYNTPPIVKKLSYLLGIKNHSIRQITSAVEKTGILRDHTIGKDSPFDYIEVIEIEENDHHDGHISDKVFEYYQKTKFNTKNQRRLRLIIEVCILFENYTIEENGTKFNIKFKKEIEHLKIQLSGSSQSEAEESIQNIVDCSRDLDRETEGIHAIEHILLAQPYNLEFFGFEFSIPLSYESNIVFRQLQLRSYDERNKSAEDLISNFEEIQSLKSRVKKQDNGYRIEILKNKAALAETEKNYFTWEAAEKDATCINEYFQTSNEDELIQTLTYFTYYEENKVNENFFSFRMSFIMPSWPIRFDSNIFKTKFDLIAFENVPAHITYNTYWLDLMELKYYEDIYFKWLESSIGQDNNKHTSDCAYELIQLLEKLSDNKNCKN